MTAKRQVERSLEREMRHDMRPSRPRDALDAYMSAYFEGELGVTVSKVCLSVIIEEHRLELAQGHTLNCGSRALSYLQDVVDVAVEDPKPHRMLARASMEWEGFAYGVQAKCDQLELQRTQLAQYAWTISEQIVAANLDEATAWTKYTNGEFCPSTMEHVGRLSCINAVRSGPSRVTQPLGMDDPAYWRPLIRTSGGGTYFLRYAVSIAMIFAFASAARAISGDSDERDYPILDYEPLGRVLAQYKGIWTDYFLLNVEVLESMPVEYRRSYAVQRYIQAQSIRHTYELARSKLVAASREQEVYERDSKTLRRRLATAEAAIEQGKTSTRALQERLNMARATAAARAPAVQREKEFDAQVVEMREKDAQIRRLQDALSVSEDSLARTREFLNVLLEPATDGGRAETAPQAPINPEEWRIVFVGGHERLHHKLRKQLRGATFLHPDQSQFSPEVFDRADAVIFSIGYCSHALVYRAASEVRKRGLRAGYSNSTNVDMVLEEIRAVLFSSDDSLNRTPA